MYVKEIKVLNSYYLHFINKICFFLFPAYFLHYGRLSSFQVYLLGLYLATSIIFRTGFPGVLPQNLTECLYISIFSILGTFKNIL